MLTAIFRGCFGNVVKGTRCGIFFHRTFPQCYMITKEVRSQCDIRHMFKLHSLGEFKKNIMETKKENNLKFVTMF